jgi:uncharacterized protein
MFISSNARKVFYVIIIALSVSVSCAELAAAKKPKAAAETDKAQLFMVSMRDGVRLATDVDIPSDAKGRMPAILLRSPYSRQLGGALGMFKAFVGNRYVIVSQDMRGRYDSEGENVPFLFDQIDGYDTVEWIASQPWSDGRVSILGGSALAIAGYQAAIESPPHLKCEIAAVAPANLQSEAILWGGELRKDLAIGWAVGTGYNAETLNFMTDHPFYDDFVKKFDLSYNAGKVQAPIMHIGGWYDIFTQGTIDAYNSLQERGGPGARGMQHLILGPWTHGGEASVTQGELGFPSNASIIPMVPNILKWMKKCEEGMLKPEAMPVQYYMVGDVATNDPRWNTWKKSATWPPAGVKTQKWFLTPSGRLDASGAPKETKTFTYKFDPANPVKTAGGGNLTIGTIGSVDQRGIESRPDVLIFDSPEFTEPYAIAGPIIADLTVSTTGCDTDFTAKLTDVYPDGRSMLINDGIARVRFREADSGHMLPAVGNEKMKVRIYTGDFAYTFNKGHKMRLAISSSNHPRFSVNTNTCPDVAFPHDLLEAEYNAVKEKDDSSVHKGIKYEIVDNSIYTGGADGSALELPNLVPMAK